MHVVPAHFVEAVDLDERHDGRSVWQGAVKVSDVTDHPSGDANAGGGHLAEPSHRPRPRHGWYPQSLPASVHAQIPFVLLAYSPQLSPKVGPDASGAAPSWAHVGEDVISTVLSPPHAAMPRKSKAPTVVRMRRT
jgi:hypothetical protein